MTRLLEAWRTLERERRIAALVALGLFVSMLLPWYSKTNTVIVRNAAQATQQSLSAFQAFSFVEAAVLLVSAGVLAMLFARAEGRDFRLPGGDGMIVTVAGGWAAILIFYRLLDKPGLSGNERITSSVGLQWGIFIALLLALGMLYSGRRIHAGERAETPRSRTPRPRAHGPAPTQPSETPGAEQAAERSTEQTVARSTERANERTTARTAPRGRSRFPPPPPAAPGVSEQMSFEDPPPHEE